MHSSRSTDEAARLARALQGRFGGQSTARRLGVSGFCDTWQAQAAGGMLFVKTMPVARAEVLRAEADGLAALAATGAVRVPAVAGQWVDEEHGLALLALEWLDLKAPGRGFGERLGQALAALHCASPGGMEGRFGWALDNFLGATPQRNSWSEAAGQAGWTSFFSHQRLGAMRDRLAKAGAAAALLQAVDEVIQALPRFFDDGHVPSPSLIHGDLWSGNWGLLADGTPVVYDPAVFCSDAEAELAMMELFGDPPAGFWPAYREVAGLHPGYPRRRGLYQLYHLLNHALLFGGAYHLQALGCARSLLKPWP